MTNELTNNHTDEQSNEARTSSRTTFKEIKELKDIVDSEESPVEKPKRERKSFKPPTVVEVDTYMQEIGWGSIDKATEFVNHYAANNWYRGKTKMQNWKAAVNVWRSKDSATNKNEKPSLFNLQGMKYESGDL